MHRSRSTVVFSDEWHSCPVCDMFVDGAGSLMFAHVVIHLFAAPRRVIREDSSVIIVLCRTADVHHEVNTIAASKDLAAWDVVFFAV